MDRDRSHDDPFDEPFLDEDQLVPDYLPDELLTAHQDTARATVASASSRTRPKRIRRNRPRSAPAAPPGSGTPRPRSAGRPGVPLVIGVVVGYTGAAAMTAVWWHLAQARPQPVWQWVSWLGTALLAVATVAILAWLVWRLHALFARRRRLHRDHARQAPVDAGSLA